MIQKDTLEIVNLYFQYLRNILNKIKNNIEYVNFTFNYKELVER